MGNWTVTLWNGIHFCVFVWLCSLYRVLDHLNPVTWILAIPQVKSWYRKHGIEDMSKHINSTIASSAKTVGDLGLWEVTQVVVEGYF
jgi:hypothetical protein